MTASMWKVSKMKPVRPTVDRSPVVPNRSLCQRVKPVKPTVGRLPVVPNRSLCQPVIPKKVPPLTAMRIKMLRVHLQMTVESCEKKQRSATNYGMFFGVGVTLPLLSPDPLDGAGVFIFSIGVLGVGASIYEYFEIERELQKEIKNVQQEWNELLASLK